MNPKNTALILIGYQNDYFAKDGVLRAVIENGERSDTVLRNTVHLIDSIKGSDVSMISTPINFSSDYSEMLQADGILAAIKDAGAFREGTPGADIVNELKAFGDRLIEIPGKRGFNAFVQTDLDAVLAEKGIKNVIFAGAIASICIDSTARAAYEYGYRVFVLEDCTASRTDAEQDLFCGLIFPTYATMTNSKTLMESLSLIT
jgi:nicotinamidase-related amidase